MVAAEELPVVVIGIGTPRGLQDRPATIIATLLVLLGATRRWLVAISAGHHSWRQPR
jgi:hypothetical protein